MENIQEVKVQTKEWANPTAAGLVALAAVCFCFFALLNGHVKGTALPLMGCWLIGGFVVQFIVGLLDLKGGNHAGGNTFMFFCAFFMLATGMEAFLKYFIGTGDGGLDARIDGWAWLALTLVIWMWTPAFFKKIGILTFIVLAIDVALPFIVLTDLGIGDFKVYAAYSLLIGGLLAIYLSAAMVVNTAWGKKIYPM